MNILTQWNDRYEYLDGKLYIIEDEAPMIDLSECDKFNTHYALLVTSELTLLVVE